MDAQTQQLLVRCLDLTLLPDAPFTEHDKETLVALAGQHRVASLCVPPEALQLFAGNTQFPLTTVVNFPHGTASLQAVEQQTKNVLKCTVSDIDVVWNFTALPDLDAAAAPIDAVARQLHDATTTLKVIMETSAMDPAAITDAAAHIIKTQPRVNFLKTSTGKHVAGGATHAAVKSICTAIKASGRTDVGVKVSGGVRTVSEALQYMDIVRSVLGKAWLTPSRFRIGASSLMKDIDAHLRGDRIGTAAGQSSSSY
ncbi:hypothetical protein RI367_005156 [Sorochytrium milnesiophthora]